MFFAADVCLKHGSLTHTVTLEAGRLLIFRLQQYTGKHGFRSMISVQRHMLIVSMWRVNWPSNDPELKSLEFAQSSVLSRLSASFEVLASLLVCDATHLVLCR